MHGQNKRAHLWENSRTLHGNLKKLGFQLGTDEPQSAIIAVIMPDLERGAAMWEALLREGLYVNLARPPATPANMTLLRCSLCAEHRPSRCRPSPACSSGRAGLWGSPVRPMAKQVAGSPRRFLWPVLLLAGFLGAIALTETALFTRAPQGMADRPCPPGNGNVHLPLGTDLNRKDSRSRLQDWAELCHYRSANEAAVDRVPAAVFIGDSITSRWQLGKPAFLPAGVINRGISGQTSPQILLGLYPDAVALKPRIVHVMAGYNDIAGNTGPNRPGDFKNNIRAIADIAKANRIALVIGSLTPSKLRRGQFTAILPPA